MKSQAWWPHKQGKLGFVSLSRVMSLNGMDIHLSKEQASPKPVIELQVWLQDVGTCPPSEGSVGAKSKGRFVPTRQEQDKKDRSNKAATGGSGVILCCANQKGGENERGDPMCELSGSPIKGTASTAIPHFTNRWHTVDLMAIDAANGMLKVAVALTKAIGPNGIGQDV